MERQPVTDPFTIVAGPVGVLLLHGYNGSPAELRPLGGALAAAGYSVHAPLLPGHGGLPDALAGARHGDWLRAAVDGLALLRRRCRSVALLGFSMGGLLAITLAAREPTAALVLLAPALRLQGQRMLNLAGVAKYAVPYFYPLDRADFGDPRVRELVLQRAPELDLDDPAVVAEVRRRVRFPVASLHELVLLQVQARRALPRVSAPTIVVQGRADETVVPESAAEVERRVASAHRRILWLDDAGHQLPSEPGRERVFDAVVGWLRAHDVRD